MSKFCPKCTADTEPIEEESDVGFCVHETVVLSALTFVVGFALGRLGGPPA